MTKTILELANTVIRNHLSFEVKLLAELNLKKGSKQHSSQYSVPELLKIKIISMTLVYVYSGT